MPRSCTPRTRRAGSRLDEHEERVSAALAARTFDDLAALTADLVPAANRAPPRPQLSLVSTDGDEPDRVTAISPKATGSGPWSVHKITYANVLLGSVTLDLTEATLPEPATIEVNCTQLLGQITIRVPLGTTVRMETANVLGDASVKHIGEPDPAMPDGGRPGHQHPRRGLRPRPQAAADLATPRSLSGVMDELFAPPVVRMEAALAELPLTATRSPLSSSSRSWSSPFPR